MDPNPSMDLPDLSPLHFSVKALLQVGVSNPEFAHFSHL